MPSTASSSYTPARRSTLMSFTIICRSTA